MAEAQQAAAAAGGAATTSDSVLETIFKEGIRPADDSERTYAANLIETFVKTQMQPGMVVSTTPSGASTPGCR